jgi:hypothetical protein
MPALNALLGDETTDQRRPALTGNRLIDLHPPRANPGGR